MTEISIKILLVEDSDTDALFLEHELARWPFGTFSISRALSLEQALHLLEEPQFDAVVLDLGLPDSRGLETLERMHEQNRRKIPIVVLTGVDDEDLGILALKQGAEDYLIKGASRDGPRAVRYAVERKRSQEDVRKSKEQLAMAVEAAELGIFDWDLENGVIVWSFHCAKLLGFEGEDGNGTYESLDACVHPDDREGMRAAVKQSLEDLKEFRHEYRVIWPDGSAHWIEARGRVFRDYHGHSARLMGTMMDISIRKIAEEAAKVRELELTRLARAKLTPREVTLLKQVAGGSANKRIASNLNISIRTVAKHRAHLMAKTNAQNAADLARMCMLAGIVPET